MSATDNHSLVWRKSSACTSGECVEVAHYGSGVMVRNPMTPSVVLCFPVASWRYFTVGIAACEGVGDRPGEIAGDTRYADMINGVESITVGSGVSQC